jgi:hypothetical protein
VKANQLQLALNKNKIGWLKIRMGDLLFMDHMHCFRHLESLCHWGHPKIMGVGKCSQNLNIWPKFQSIFGTDKFFENGKF